MGQTFRPRLSVKHLLSYKRVCALLLFDEMFFPKWHHFTRSYPQKTSSSATAKGSEGKLEILKVLPGRTGMDSQVKIRSATIPSRIPSYEVDFLSRLRQETVKPCSGFAIWLDTVVGSNGLLPRIRNTGVRRGQGGLWAPPPRPVRRSAHQG